jgi:hypothetical protein
MIRHWPTHASVLPDHNRAIRFSRGFQRDGLVRVDIEDFAPTSSQPLFELVMRLGSIAFTHVASALDSYWPQPSLFTTHMIMLGTLYN